MIEDLEDIKYDEEERESNHFWSKALMILYMPFVFAAFPTILMLLQEIYAFICKKLCKRKRKIDQKFD